MVCEYKGKYSLIEFEVVDHEVPNILGLPRCTAMKPVKRIDSIHQTPEDIFEEFKYLFNGLGCITCTNHHIEVDATYSPVVNPPCRVLVLLKWRVQDEIKRMEQLGIVEKVREPTNWVNSMVVATKPNGKLQICIDPRDLNKAIKCEHYQMKTIEEVITQMPNAQVFSVLDTSSGFLGK